MKRIIIVLILVVVTIALSVFIKHKAGRNTISKSHVTSTKISAGLAPDINQVPSTPKGDLIRYGHSLITNTSYYFGPNGIIQKLSNGMNCQNCHLEAGTKLFGNNFYLVASGYPRYKDRSGAIESIKTKVEDCFERSMNGQMIDSNGKEMNAFVAYLNWVGSNVSKDKKPIGTGLQELPFITRAADTSKGRIVFRNKCQVCHGKNGEGQPGSDSSGKSYPPLWGAFSYNIGASIYRLSKMASFVKDNMPYGASHDVSQLTNEEAWDVAAFLNAQDHPYKDLNGDWPILTKKPYDYPFGPYAEKQFSESDHKYGPFAPIKNYYSAINKK